MKVWTTTDFAGHYPVGVAAVVCADTAMQAAELLNVQLRARGLAGDATAEGMQRFVTSKPGCEILSDGDY